MKKNKSLAKAILIIFIMVLVLSFIGTIYVNEAVQSGEISIFEDVFGIETSFPLILIMIFLALIVQFLPFIILFGFVIFIISFSKKLTEQNKENIKENTSVKKVSEIRSVHNIHVSKGSPEDALARERTGESLHKDDCPQCEKLDPWDTPSKFRKFLSGRDNEVDDVEAYYREKGMKRKK